MLQQRPSTILTLLFFAVALLLAACGSGANSVATPTPSLSAEAAQGQALFQGKGRCATCHALSPETIIVGPSLAGIATHAASRVAGLSAAEYLEASILFPDSYIVPGFENQQMPTTLAKELSVPEVEALVAYMLTLD
ncbi:MAG: cytochrome c [Ardenticatenales bacterium]|nr:cytochrome c [Ardenticatenales bacterium]